MLFATGYRLALRGGFCVESGSALFAVFRKPEELCSQSRPAVSSTKAIDAPFIML